MEIIESNWENTSWQLVQRPKGKKKSLKWSGRLEQNSSGSLQRLKSRLITKC